MTTVVEYRCPQCNHHIFNSVFAGDPNSPPPNAAGSGLSAPTGDVGRQGNTCPKCGGIKSPGYETCLECNKENMDKCPQCGATKQKRYPKCYQCSQGTNVPNSANPPENAYEQEDDDDAPF